MSRLNMLLPISGTCPHQAALLPTSQPHFRSAHRAALTHLAPAAHAGEPPAGAAKAGSKRAKPEDACRNIATFVASHNWKDLAQAGTLAKLTVADLEMYLEYHRLKKTGNKAAKIERIKEHLGL
jgi:hypothetical protein